MVNEIYNEIWNTSYIQASRSIIVKVALFLFMWMWKLK